MTNPRISFLSAPDQCPYLPDRVTQMRYEIERGLTAVSYGERVEQGWRRFGPILFRHECPSCRSCESIRVPVHTFRPSQSQRRAWKKNAGSVAMRVGVPSSSDEKLQLLRRFHLHGHRTKGWPLDPGQDLSLFTNNPLPTEEWSYSVHGQLAAVGYVDVLPDGLSAIYFFHDPDAGHRSLGTFNILTLIEVARERRLQHVYLGYYVRGCRSLEYKARFRPNERLSPGGQWTAI